MRGLWLQHRSACRYQRGILPDTTVWTSGTGPLPSKKWSGCGQRPKRLRRDDEHKPISVRRARSWPPQALLAHDDFGHLKRDIAARANFAPILISCSFRLVSDQSVIGRRRMWRCSSGKILAFFRLSAKDNSYKVCTRCEPQALANFSWRRCPHGGGRHALTSLVPGPREQFVDLLHRMVRQADKDVGEPGMRIDVI